MTKEPKIHFSLRLLRTSPQSSARLDAFLGYLRSLPFLPELLLLIDRIFHDLLFFG